VAYQIEYSPYAVEQLRLLETRDQRTVLDKVDEQLAHEPLTETKNRKPMRPNPLAPWELRVGQVRVYHEAKEEPEPIVRVLAVGIKDRNVARIGGEEIEL
jgi:mRNA-degrading endonuclease RelE of RelBE toxin-antitoxin system